MTETLSQWEKQRAEVVRDIAGFGDFRRSSITGIIGRCGKANCGCDGRFEDYWEGRRAA